MSTLVAGVLLWCVVHLFPSLAPAARTRLVLRLGRKPYRGLFAGLIVAALGLIVIGWRNVTLVNVYAPPFYGGLLVPLLMFVSFYLLAAASAPGNAVRILRHPMLLGTVIWASAHLLANGDNRSIVLFGGFGLWALLEIILVNRREKSWRRPASVPFRKDLLTLAASGVVFGVVLYLHGFLFGVSPIPGN